MALGYTFGDPVGEIVFGSFIRSIPVLTTTVDTFVVKRNADLNGYSFVETTGTTRAQIQIFDGLDAKGTIVAEITLQAGESVRDWFNIFGIRLHTGCFIHVISGSIRGAVWLRL